MAIITRNEYMQNSSELHHAYFLQFATDSTKNFILRSLNKSDIKKALENGDVHLNKLKIPYNDMSHSGSWWWDKSPLNVALLREAGEWNSQSTRTCVGKAVAKELAK